MLFSVSIYFDCFYQLGLKIIFFLFFFNFLFFVFICVDGGYTNPTPPITFAWGLVPVIDSLESKCYRNTNPSVHNIYSNNNF